jgi:hypothetical protein
VNRAVRRHSDLTEVSDRTANVASEASTAANEWSQVNIVATVTPNQVVDHITPPAAWDKTDEASQVSVDRFLGAPQGSAEIGPAISPNGLERN